MDGLTPLEVIFLFFWEWREQFGTTATSMSPLSVSFFFLKNFSPLFVTLLVLARVHEPARAMNLGRNSRSSKIFF